MSWSAGMADKEIHTKNLPVPPHDKKRRISWIDVSKGVAIILVTLGHNPYIGDTPGKAFEVIFSFHIPLFFFLSGLFFKSDTSLSELILKKYKALLKPYLFTMFFVVVLYSFFKRQYSFPGYLFWALYANGPDLPKSAIHLWFLPSLFITTVACWFLYRGFPFLKRSTGYQMISVVVMLVGGVIVARQLWSCDIGAVMTALGIGNGTILLTGLPWSIDILPLTVSFFMLGYICEKIGPDRVVRSTGVVAAAIVIFVLIHSLYHCTMDLNMRRYDNIAASTILAFSGICISLCLSSIISEWCVTVSGSIQYLGRHSLVVFILHPIIQGKVFYSLSERLPTLPFLAFLVSFAAGIFVPLLVNYLFLERFGVFRKWYYAAS